MTQPTPAPGREDARAYDSHAAFYQDVYGRYLSEMRPVGRLGAHLLRAQQPSGDWSDAATPDLVLVELMNRPARVSLDLGSGRFVTTMRPCEFIVVSPAVATSMQVDDDHAIRFVSLPYAALCSLAGDDAGLSPDGDFGPLHRSTNLDPDVSRLLHALWTEADPGRPGGALLADATLLTLAAHLLRLAHRAPPPSRGRLAPWQVKRVCDFLLDHLADDTSLADLADLVGLSPHHFCRAFKASTGLPPHRWRQARRIDRARELLVTTRLAVGEVAAAVGYDEPGQLAAAFRQATGLSPTQFRREQSR